MKNPLENKSLEELKTEKAKYTRILAIFIGIMSVSMVVTIYTVIKTKNYAFLGTLALFLTFLPMYASIMMLDKEIKRREAIK